VITIRHQSDANEVGVVDGASIAARPRDERHLRIKAIALSDGSKIFFDLPEAIVLSAGDEVVLDKGRVVLIKASEEQLICVAAKNTLNLIELAWHNGKRYFPTEIPMDHILVQRDHVIKTMLEGLGAIVVEVLSPFNPLRGAYSPHNANHTHGHDHSSAHEHERVGR